eukprot:1198124-Amphidinium_carterae.1
MEMYSGLLMEIKSSWKSEWETEQQQQKHSEPMAKRSDSTVIQVTLNSEDELTLAVTKNQKTAATAADSTE